MLTINTRQTLVLDTSLIATGIVADKPDLTRSYTGAKATSRLNNATSRAVTLHYRFYWYDDEGLDILPYDEVRTVVVPPGAEIRLQAVHTSADIRQVRLHLFL